MTKFIICIVVVFAAIITCTKACIDGGLGESEPVNGYINALVERQRADIIRTICATGSHCPASDARFVANNYKRQTVAGTNYFVSLTVDGILYHVRIFSQPWTHTEEVHAVVGPKTVADVISYF